MIKNPPLPANLIFHQMQVGPMANFQYFIGDKQTKEVALVDPAWDADYFSSEAKQRGYKISSIFLTHGHHDHVNALEETLKRHDVPVYISKYEAPIYYPRQPNLITVEDRQKLKIGNIEFECFHTPGHSPGCQCFYYQNMLITGDMVFIDGCGRCDLPGSDVKQMYHSLYHILLKFPDATVLYPGHDYGPTPSATLASQKKTNPYLTCDSQEEFLQTRMGIVF